jgi:hypothetical protein
MKTLSVAELIASEPHNYAYMTGALLALIYLIETELDVARALKCKPSVKEIRRHIERAKQLDTIQKASLALERTNNHA